MHCNTVYEVGRRFIFPHLGFKSFTTTMQAYYLIFSFTLLAECLSIPRNFPEYSNGSLSTEVNENIELCESNPCQNGGTCLSEGENYKCLCRSRYGGRLCDHKVCTPREVKNCGAAKCVFGESSRRAVCVCPEGELFDFFTLTCYEDLCKKYTPCENGGTCVTHSRISYQCICPERFGGPQCKIKVCTTTEKSVCWPVICEFEESSGRGECVCEGRRRFNTVTKTCEECDCGPNTDCSFLENEKKCTCKSGYVQKDNKCIRKCWSFNPCRNQGSCESGYCVCRPGTSGDYCEVVDRCYFLCPQVPGISCVAGRDEPYCKCDDPKLSYDKERRRCRVQCVLGAIHCKNGGFCSSQQGSSFCQCPKGMEGDFCEQVPA